MKAKYNIGDKVEFECDGPLGYVDLKGKIEKIKIEITKGYRKIGYDIKLNKHSIVTNVSEEDIIRKCKIKEKK